MAIKHLSGRMAGETDIVCRHIYGHQDSARGLGKEHSAMLEASYSMNSEEIQEGEDFEVISDHGTKHQPRPLSLAVRNNYRMRPNCDQDKLGGKGWEHRAGTTGH